MSSAELFIIPPEVIFISENAFEGIQPILSVEEGTYAEAWGKRHGMQLLIRPMN